MAAENKHAFIFLYVLGTKGCENEMNYKQQLAEHMY